MFRGSCCEEGSSRPAECAQAAASGQLPDVAAAGPSVHTGDATSAVVPVEQRSTYPTGATAQATANRRTAPRRSYSYKVKQTLDEMAQLLEIPAEVRVELPDEDIVAMSTQYIQKMTPPDGVPLLSREANNDFPLDMYLAALDGFVLHVGRNGKFRYISQNVLEYLGFTAEEMVGKRILDFIHPTDRAELEKVLVMGFNNNDCIQSTSNIRLELFLRMKHHFQKQSRVSNNDGYMVIHCVGFVDTLISPQRSRLPKTSGFSPCLWIVGRPLKPSFVLKYQINMAAFVIRTGLNLQPNFADSELLRLLGYSAWEFSSCSLYQHVHPSDTMDFRRSHYTVLQKGQSLSHYYRMLTKYGEYVWIQTQFSLISNDFSPSQNCIVSLNYVLGGERRVGRFSAPSSKMRNSTVTNANQFVGQQCLKDTAPDNSCVICEGDCCYNVPNTSPLIPRKTFKCDTCDRHNMVSNFSKGSSPHLDACNATQLQFRKICSERGQSTYRSGESIHSMHASSKYACLPRLLQEPCAYRRNQPQATADVYKRCNEQSCYPETNRNFMAHAGNSRATSSQNSWIPTLPMNNFNSYSAVSSTFQRGGSHSGTGSQETSAKRNPSTRNIKRCSYPTQQQSFHTSPETFNNFVSNSIMNSFNENGISGGLIDTYDVCSSLTSVPSNTDTVLQNSYQPLSGFGNTVGCSYPTYLNNNPSQVTVNSNKLHSESHIPSANSSLADIKAEMKCGTNYGAFGSSVTPESNNTQWQKFARYHVESSTDFDTVPSSSSLQTGCVGVNQDCISSRTFDLPLESESYTGVQNASGNDTVEPDVVMLNEVMRQLDNKLGVKWEIALQNFSGQQDGM